MPRLSPLILAIAVFPAAATEYFRLPAVRNADWELRCAECHVVYHPGLLPERSWRALMASPKRHFGRNIGVQAADTAIAEFLAANAADRSSHPVSQAIAASISASSKPTSPSGTDWFRRTHGKLPKVEHFHDCRVCHRFAAEGDFRVIHD